MDKISIEVAFATPEKQAVAAVTVEADSTVEQAIGISGILNQFSEIDLQAMSVGVFGKVCQLDRVVDQGERVEIYRPLMQNPMDARRNRAVKAK